MHVKMDGRKEWKKEERGGSQDLYKFGKIIKPAARSTSSSFIENVFTFVPSGISRLGISHAYVLHEPPGFSCTATALKK